MRNLILASALALGLIAACGSDDKKAAPAPQPMKLEATTKSLQENLITPLCVKCHNHERATRGVNLEDIQATLEGREVLPPPRPGSHPHRHRSIIAGCPKRSLFYLKMKDGSMPPADRQGHQRLITAEELKVVEEWVLKAGRPCGSDASEPGTPEEPIDP